MYIQYIYIGKVYPCMQPTTLEYIIERIICIPTNCYTKSEEVYDCPDQSNHAEMSFSQYYCLPTW